MNSQQTNSTKQTSSPSTRLQQTPIHNIISDTKTKTPRIIMNKFNHDSPILNIATITNTPRSRTSRLFKHPSKQSISPLHSSLTDTKTQKIRKDKSNSNSLNILNLSQPNNALQVKASSRGNHLTSRTSKQTTNLTTNTPTNHCISYQGNHTKTKSFRNSKCMKY